MGPSGIDIVKMHMGSNPIGSKNFLIAPMAEWLKALDS